MGPCWLSGTTRTALSLPSPEALVRDKRGLLGQRMGKSGPKMRVRTSLLPLQCSCAPAAALLELLKDQMEWRRSGDTAQLCELLSLHTSPPGKPLKPVVFHLTTIESHLDWSLINEPSQGHTTYLETLFWSN